MGIDLTGKRLALLREAVPNLSRVALLLDATDPDKERTIRTNLTAAQALGISLWSAQISGPSDVEPVFVKMAQDRADGFVRGYGSTLFPLRARIGAFGYGTPPARNNVYWRGALLRPSDVVWAGFPGFFRPRCGLRR